MKKNINISIVLAIITMICSTLCLSSCYDEEELTSQDIALRRNILGKWKTYSIDGKLGVTNQKEVITYLNDGTFHSSTFRQNAASYNCKYYLNGNSYIGVNNNYTVKAVISSISNDEIVYSNFANNQGFKCKSMVSHKIKVDYSQDIIGLWECVEITGESTFDSPDNRWEYKDDGSYTYYSKDADGNWIADATNSGNEYYVDGDFLATRWTMNGKETRESWDIEKCDDSEMIWSALRIGKNGKEFTTKVILRRVSDL